MTQQAQDQIMTVADVISTMGIAGALGKSLSPQKQTPPLCGAVQRIRRSAFETWLGQHENAAADNT